MTRLVPAFLAVLLVTAAGVGVTSAQDNATATENDQADQVRYDLGEGVTLVGLERDGRHIVMTLEVELPGTLVWWSDIQAMNQAGEDSDGLVALNPDNYQRQLELDSGRQTVRIGPVPAADGTYRVPVWTDERGTRIPIEVDGSSVSLDLPGDPRGLDIPLAGATVAAEFTLACLGVVALKKYREGGEEDVV